ncbi:MAG: hypothetical protein AAF968_13265 [Pseudomonadota bacterium]
MRTPWNNRHALLGLNLSTAFVWVADFFSRQMTLPAVVFTIFSGLIPVAILILSALGIAAASGLRNTIEGAGLVIIVVAIIYVAAITLLGQSGFVQAAGW